MSTTRCAACGGRGTVEQTQRPSKGTGHVQRTRGCVSCGQTWTTVEIPAVTARRLLKLDKFIRSLR